MMKIPLEPYLSSGLLINGYLSPAVISASLYSFCSDRLPVLSQIQASEAPVSKAVPDRLICLCTSKAVPVSDSRAIPLSLCNFDHAFHEQIRKRGYDSINLFFLAKLCHCINIRNRNHVRCICILSCRSIWVTITDDCIISRSFDFLTSCTNSPSVPSISNLCFILRLPPIL